MSNASASLQPMGRTFTTTRTLDAPRDLVWKAWSEPERLAHWWGPTGCEVEITRFEFRPGGRFVFSMTLPDGTVMWGRFVYREIQAPERLVWIHSFADEHGDLAVNEFHADWPKEMLNTVTLEEQDGKTILTLTSISLNATESEVAVFEANFGSMTEGYGGTWDQLEAYLAGAQATA